MSEGVGLVEAIETKQTVKGKDFVNYRINGTFFNDFNNNPIKVKVGDKVSFEFTESGKFKNLVSVEKFEGKDVIKEALGIVKNNSLDSNTVHVTSGTVWPNQKEFVSPAFAGMCANQAVQVALAKMQRTNTIAEVWDKLVEEEFEGLFKLWSKKWEEKGVK